MKFDPYIFKQADANGVPVFFKNIPWADGYVYIYITAGVGSRFDPVGREGLAHFFEHTPFNGSKQHPSIAAIQSFDRKSMLDSLNANTDFDRTMYHAKVSTSCLQAAMEFFGSFIFEPLLTDEAIERERKVITQEFWRKYASHQTAALSKTIKQSLYRDHPFGRIGTALGWDDTIAQMSRADLVGFHEHYYHRGNTTLVLVGDIDETFAILAGETLARFAPHGEPTPRPEKLTRLWSPKHLEITVSAEDFFGLKGESKLQKTVIAIHRLLPIQENEKVVDIAGCLVRQLLMERIRYVLAATYSPRVNMTEYSDHLYMTFTLEVAPDTESQVRAIVSAVLAEISAGEPRHEALFEELKSAYVQQRRFTDTTCGKVADNFSNDLATHGQVRSITEDVALSEAVRYADVSALLAKEFAPEYLLWSITRP